MAAPAPDARAGRLEQHAVEAGRFADGMTAVPEFRRDVVEASSAEPQGGFMPPALRLEGSDDDPLAAHERGQVQGMESAVALAADVPPSLAGIRVADDPERLRREIFNVLQENEDLVSEPFERLIAKRELLGVPYDGFWRSMDTFKDRMNLEELWGREKAPWKVWNR